MLNIKIKLVTIISYQLPIGYLVEVCVRQDRKLLLDRLQQPDCYFKAIVCLVSQLCWVFYRPERPSCFCFHVVGPSRVPSDTKQ